MGLNMGFGSYELPELVINLVLLTERATWDDLSRADGFVPTPSVDIAALNNSGHTSYL